VNKIAPKKGPIDILEIHWKKIGVSLTTAGAEDQRSPCRPSGGITRKRRGNVGKEKTIQKKSRLGSEVETEFRKQRAGCSALMQKCKAAPEKLFPVYVRAAAGKRDKAGRKFEKGAVPC